MRMIVIAILTVMLAGCGGGDSGGYVPPPPGPLVGQLAIPASWNFNFPVYPKVPTTQCVSDPSCQKVGYIIQAVYARISGNIRFKFEIVEGGSPIYQHALKADNVCGGPSTLQLYFQRYGDNGMNEFGRWWSSTRAVLGPGQQEIVVPLNGEGWSSVYGKFGKDAPLMFADALANVGQIGMTFGGGCFAGHGVNINGGSSHFTSMEYEIKP